MYYSRFIESLLEESVRAHLGGYNIEDVVDISSYEEDSVYATLVSVVCDPRFQSTVKASKGWRDAAREELEELMDSLLYDEDDSPADDDTLKSSILQSLTDIATTPPELPPVENSSEEMFEMPPIGGSNDSDNSVYTAVEMREKQREGANKSEDNDKSTDESEEPDEDSPFEKEEEENEIQKDRNNATAEEFLNSFFFRSLKQSASRPPKLPPVDSSSNGDDTDNQKGNKERPQNSQTQSQKHSISRALDDFSNILPQNEQSDENDDIPPEQESRERRNPGNGISPSIEEQKKLELRFLRSLPPSLVRLAKLIGRSGDNDMVPSGKFLSAAKSDIAGITVGNDLSNLLPSEIAMLASPSTEDIFLRKYAEKRLQIFASASSGENPVRHQDGPIIICLDVSGSMKGEKMLLAIALSFAVCIIAKRQHRKMLIVKYSDSHEMVEVKNLRRQRIELLNFFKVHGIGGNNEDRMFSWLFQQVLPEYGKFKSADVLCISDFGWSEISYKTMALIDEKKADGMLFYGLNVEPMDYPDWSEVHGANKVIDSMWDWDFNKNMCTGTKS